jgi:hypothetical protein
MVMTKYVTNGALFGKPAQIPDLRRFMADLSKAMKGRLVRHDLEIEGVRIVAHPIVKWSESKGKYSVSLTEARLEVRGARRRLVGNSFLVPEGEEYKLPTLRINLGRSKAALAKEIKRVLVEPSKTALQKHRAWNEQQEANDKALGKALAQHLRGGPVSREQKQILKRHKIATL